MTHDPFTAPAEPASFAPQDRSRAQAAGLPLEDGLELLRRDHQAVARLVADYDQAADTVDKVSIAERLCVALTVHAQIEEELFYPALRQAGVFRDRVDNAVVEHLALRRLVADVESAGIDDALLDAKVRVLGVYFLRHAQEEEAELFEAARERGVDLALLGRRLAARRAELCRQAALNMKSRLRVAGGPAAQLAAEHPTATSAAVAGALSPLNAAGAVADLALTVLPGGGRLRRLLKPGRPAPRRTPPGPGREVRF